MQRGFLPYRAMLRNIIDIDWYAQKVSIKSRRGIILLFDFRAAFHSVSHQFMWASLEAFGLPAAFIRAIQLFYVDNKHSIKIAGQIFEGPIMKSGVRQGCPLSAILFVMCVDTLLRRIRSVLGQDEVARACADDVAAVLMDYASLAGLISQIFQDFSKISDLSLNIAKTVFVPLRPVQDFDHLRRLIIEACALWRDIKIATTGKLLGVYVGPGSIGHSWVKPLAKLKKRLSYGRRNT